MRRPLAVPGTITPHVPTKRGHVLSRFAEDAIARSRVELLPASDV